MGAILWYFIVFNAFSELVAGQRPTGYGAYPGNDPQKTSGDVVYGPSFVASPQNISAPEGSDVSFPCNFHARGPQENLYMMIFKYISPKDEDRIYYAGETKVTHFPRIKKEGSSFVLSDVKATDSGNYVCRFETKPLTQVSHRLEVLYPPKVFRESAELQRVSQGANVVLQCSAEGNPKPTITWTKQGGFLPSGGQSVEGYSITFEEVDRHVEGTYVCAASNGIGTSSSVSVTVQVEYPPEIISEQSIIHTGEGSDAKLVCVVHGRPSPDVKWLRGTSLVSSDKHMMTHDGAHRHTLTITDVTEEDFGEYTCKAFNNIGSVQNKFELTGLPRKPHITSNPKGTSETNYSMKWITETSSPLVQYRLKYRKIVGSGSEGGKWKDSLYFPNNKNITQVRQGVYQIRHTLDHIRPATQMEAIVQVENKFGWSQQSDVFKFQTKKAVPTTTTTEAPRSQTFNHGPKVEEVAVGQSSFRCTKANIQNIVLAFTGVLLIRLYN